MKVFASLGVLRLTGGPGGLWLHIRLAWRLLSDARVPLLNKMIIPATAFYFVWPLDFMPDILPFLGHVDDVTAIVLALLLFVRTCPQRLVAEHRAKILGRRRDQTTRMKERDNTIEGEYRVLDDE